MESYDKRNYFKANFSFISSNIPATNINGLLIPNSDLYIFAA